MPAAAATAASGAGSQRSVRGAPTVGVKRLAAATSPGRPVGLARSKSRDKENSEPLRNDILRNRSPRSPMKPPVPKTSACQARTKQPASPPSQQPRAVPPASPLSQSRSLRVTGSPPGGDPASPLAQSRPMRQVPGTRAPPMVPGTRAPPMVMSPPLCDRSQAVTSSPPSRHRDLVAQQSIAASPQSRHRDIASPKAVSSSPQSRHRDVSARVQAPNRGLTSHASASSSRAFGSSRGHDIHSTPRQTTRAIVAVACPPTCSSFGPPSSTETLLKELSQNLDGRAARSRGTPSSSPRLRCREISPEASTKPAFSSQMPSAKRTLYGRSLNLVH